MFKFLKKTALWIIAVPVLCFVLGAGLNQLVLAANHDQFPVMWSDYKAAEYEFSLVQKAEKGDVEAEFNLVALRTEGFIDEEHVLMTRQTHLNWLADWCALGNATYSPGDGLLFLGSYGLNYCFIVWGVVVLGKLRKE